MRLSVSKEVRDIKDIKGVTAWNLSPIGLL